MEDSVKEKLKHEIIGILLIAVAVFLFSKFGLLSSYGSLFLFLHLLKGQGSS